MDNRQIPVHRIIMKLDELFSRNDLNEAGRLLRYWESEAEALGDKSGLLTILSEEMGYYRRAGDSERGLDAVQRGLQLIQSEGLGGDVSGATVMLNAATTMKAFGHAGDSVVIYAMAEEVYKKQLDSDDYRLAGLYNNFASALTELKEYKKARDMYNAAATIILTWGDHKEELAVTYVNTAHLICDENMEDPAAEEYMRRAWKILDSIDTRDGNYAFVAEKCAPSFGYFGFFREEKELRRRAEEIYDRS